MSLVHKAKPLNSNLNKDSFDCTLSSGYYEMLEIDVSKYGNVTVSATLVRRTASTNNTTLCYKLTNEKTITATSCGDYEFTGGTQFHVGQLAVGTTNEITIDTTGYNYLQIRNVYKSSSSYGASVTNYIKVTPQ